MNLIDRVKKWPHGMSVLADWLGPNGIVVSQEHAQRRADVCTGRLNGAPCPMNVKNYPIEEKVAAFVHKVFELQTKLNLKVMGNKSLYACSGCGGCPLKSKIWQDIERIKPQPGDVFDPRCWLLLETTPNPDYTNYSE